MIPLLARLSTETAADTSGLSLFDQITALTIELAIVVVMAGLLLCVIRLIRGPHLADRALAADTISVHLVALVALFTMHFDTLAFFDGALVISLLGFATSIAMAQFIIRRHLRRLGLHEEPASPPHETTPSQEASR